MHFQQQQKKILFLLSNFIILDTFFFSYPTLFTEKKKKKRPHTHNIFILHYNTNSSLFVCFLFFFPSQFSFQIEVNFLILDNKLIKIGVFGTEK
jgi:hypothetical protein